MGIPVKLEVFEGPLRHLYLQGNFNTSHVTVYLHIYSFGFTSRYISIHLMLLFI